MLQMHLVGIGIRVFRLPLLEEVAKREHDEMNAEVIPTSCDLSCEDSRAL